MEKTLEGRLFQVWLILSAVTLVTWFLGVERRMANVQISAVVTYCALLLAVVKVRVIFVEFMEARRVSKTLLSLLDIWLLLLAAALMAIYALKLEMPPV